MVCVGSWADCIIGLKTSCKNWPGAAWLLLVAHIFASVQAAVTPWKGGGGQWVTGKGLGKLWKNLGPNFSRFESHEIYSRVIDYVPEDFGKPGSTKYNRQVDKQGRLNMTSCHSCRGLAECLRPACLTNKGATSDISGAVWFGPSEAHAKPTFHLPASWSLAFGRSAQTDPPTSPSVNFRGWPFKGLPLKAQVVIFQ